LCRRLESIGERIEDDDFPSSPRERAEGYRHVLRLLTFATQWATEFGDPDFPAFLRTTDDAVKFGGPSADNRNLRARVDGTGTYRVTGNVGSAFDVLFTAAAGDMALGQTGVSHERSASDFDVSPDGSFELIVSGTKHAGNWLPMAPETRRIQVRQIFTDWASQEPGWFSIERIDRATLYPEDSSPERMAAMLGQIGDWVEHSTTYWNDYQRAIRDRLVWNTIEAPAPQEGGALSIRYGFGWWDLAPGEGLVVTFPRPPARYWSLQPYSPGWFEALDYRNHLSTLNNAQAAVDADGLVRIVVSATDPGGPNWIDTTDLPQGQLIYRWIWADESAESVAPECTVITVEPSDVDRTAELAERRRAVARRHRR
jgi:hypothetical protein